MGILYGILGAGGCGRGVMPIARSQLASEDRLVFIDDRLAGQTTNGHEVVTLEDFVERSQGRGRVALAVADGNARRILAERCRTRGLGFFDIRAAETVIMDDVQLGEGALISPFVTFTSNIVIGRFFHANLYSCVEHDCVIGDFVTFAPGVRCNGNIHIGDGAYIGSGAVIKQGAAGAPLVIGAGAVVGMGAVVTRSVPPRSTVVGNPARLMARMHPAVAPVATAIGRAENGEV